MLDSITALAKRRGFIFPSSLLYGGLANTYDFGPYGTQLKQNILSIWWKRFIENREDMYGIDSSIILNPLVWEASGHTEGFSDVMVEDTKTNERYRADHLIEDYFQAQNKQVKVDGMTPDQIEEIIHKESILSPLGNPLGKPKKFNLLFQTEIGIIASQKNKAYLRGEIAQGLFLNFKNILDSMHPKLPFGIGQAGKAFRNEITMGKFTFRTLEFDLMEFEYFFDPNTNTWEELFAYWKKEMSDFARSLGLTDDRLRWREHEDFERSFYSSRTEDLEYKFPWGYKEMFGLAYRTDYDLKNHMEKSGKDVRFTYPDGTKILPHVVEPTFGLSRLATILLIDSYHQEELKEGKSRTVLRFHPSVAPVQVAVFPLQKKEELIPKAREVFNLVQTEYRTEFDNLGNIGKMYRKQDEIGTPLCITIDYDSLQDDSVTVRYRDTMKQERLAISQIMSFLQHQLQ